MLGMLTHQIQPSMGYLGPAMVELHPWWLVVELVWLMKITLCILPCTVNLHLEMTHSNYFEKFVLCDVLLAYCEKGVKN